jgi:hypothetical protein
MTTMVSSLTAAGEPTERSSPLRLVRGLFATALCALLACALQGALFAPGARAAAPGLVPSGEFGSKGGLGVAVDQSSGDVFVTGFLSISALGEVTAGLGGKFDASGNLLLSFGEETLNYGAAVNPTNGELYVASSFGEIDTYDPNTGALLSSFPVPSFWAVDNFTEVFNDPTQIATDSAGNVYVSNFPNNEVLEYSSTGTLLKTFTGSGAHALSEPTGVAVDSSGNVWVADDGSNRIEEFDPTGEFKSEIKSEGVRSLALDAHGDVFAIVYNSADDCGSLPSPCGHLVEYSAGGAQLADVGAGDFGLAGEHYSPWSMVAVDDASGRVYVTDGFKNVVRIYQPPVLPTVGSESAAEVGVSEAKLGAVATSGGGEATYRFEYLTEAAFQANKESFSGPEEPVSVPFPEGSVGQGLSARTVWASAKGLTPGTTYHYRAVVTNVLRPVAGPDETFTTETLAQTACPNEQTRGGFSAALPDCRAYEAVVPPNKASAQPNSGYPANDGNRYLEYGSHLPGSTSAGLWYLATRGASGWSAESALPRQYMNGDRCAEYGPGGADIVAFSPDGSKSVISDNNEEGYAEDPCHGGELHEVVPGETPNVVNLLLRDNTDGAYRLIDVPPPGVEATAAGLVAYSADLNLVIFGNGAKLTPEAPSTGGTYEWNEGVVHFLQLALPNGTPVEGSIVHISSDGADVFFTAGGDLYVRVNDERTVQVDEARGGAGPGGGGSYAGLTADGSQVFFTADASKGLTKDTVSGSGSNLYSFDVDTSQLSDLTPVSDAKAGFVGIGQDGAHVYFTAESVMSGSQSNQFGETAESGKSNLYLSHGGTITFVKHGGGEVSVSPNGAFLAFGSYIYSAASNRSECWSCNPFGVPGGVENSDGPSNNGQVFFQTSEALLPRDTNGQADVYEYEYAGGLHLISTGTSSSGSTLQGSSESGNDVFFLGRQALLPGEPNVEFNGIYDARVDGGFPATEVPVCTTADACRAAPVPEPSIFGEPASQTFSGAGNLAPPPPVLKTAVKPKKCKQGFVKNKKGKCVKSKVRKKKAKAKKSAHTNRRGK